jgi:hypothetical protein
MFISVITAPIVLAQLIDFLIRRCYVNPQCSNIHPANSICLAYSRYEYGCANTIGVVMVSYYWPKFAALCLFVETSPINYAGKSGKRNRYFIQKLHLQMANSYRWPQSQTDVQLIVSFPTHLHFRYKRLFYSNIGTQVREMSDLALSI